MKKWLFLAAAIGFEVTATLALRAANDHLGWLALVVVGYPVSFAFLAMLLREGMSIGVAYGVWSASGVALTALLAVPLFGDGARFRRHRRRRTSGPARFSRRRRTRPTA